MCKPSCCPGQNHSSLPAAVAVVAGLVVISAAARPLIHAAELVIQAALITIGAAVTLAVVALVTILLTRARRATIRPGAGLPVTAHAAIEPHPSARTWAQAAIADRIHALEPADRPVAEAIHRQDGALGRCPACGVTPRRRDPDAR
jgi:hypothetical protein